MDYVNLSASMTMLELVRFLLQDTNNSFSFYSGKLGNLNLIIRGNSENSRSITTVCQYICKKVREVWTVHNLGIIAVDHGEMMICVTSPDPSVPAEMINFMVEALAVCLVNLVPDKARVPQASQNVVRIDDEDISPDLIQVNASLKEINERIDRFIYYKKEQANINNVLDFCGASDDRKLCARVDAVLVRKKDSSSHMAVCNILDRYTKKKEDNPEKSSVQRSSQESIVLSQVQTSSQNHDFSSEKGEKRTFDVASLESVQSNVKRHQKN